MRPSSSTSLYASSLFGLLSAGLPALLLTTQPLAAAPRPEASVSQSPTLGTGARVADVTPSTSPAEPNPWAHAPGVKEYPGASSLLLKDAIEVQARADGSYDLIERDAIRLQDKEALERFGKVFRSYDEALGTSEVQSACIWLPDGRKVDIPRSQITDTIAPGLAKHPLYGRVHVLAVDYRQAVLGAVIEYRLVHHRKAAWPEQRVWASSYTQDASPMLETAFSLTVPQGSHYEVATPGTPDLKPQSTTRDASGALTMRWNLTARPPYRREPAMPAVRDVASQIQASSFTGWDDFAGWAGRLYGKAAEADAPLRALAARLTARAATPEARAQALLDWLAKERPVLEQEMGLDESLPQPAARTAALEVSLLQQDRAVLLLALMRAAGFDAHLALVSSHEHGDPHRGVPSLGQFDRLLVTFKATPSGSVRWVDPASSVIDAPHPQVSARPALLLTDDGHATFTYTPLVAAHVNRELLQGVARIDPDGSLDATLQIFEHGANAASWRRLVATAEPAEQRQVFQMLVNGISQQASLREFYVQPGKGTEPCLVTVSFELPTAAVYAAKSRSYQLRLPLLRPRRLMGYAELPVSERTYPVCLGTPTYEEQRLELVIPKEWRVKALPASSTLENAVGSEQVDVRSKGRSIFYYNRFIIRKPSVPLQGYGDFRSLVQRLGENAQLRFELEGPAPVTQPSSASD